MLAWQPTVELWQKKKLTKQFTFIIDFKLLKKEVKFGLPFSFYLTKALS